MAQALQIFPRQLISFSGMGDEGRKEGKVGRKEINYPGNYPDNCPKIIGLIREQPAITRQKFAA
jgi:hypothetical protein